MDHQSLNIRRFVWNLSWSENYLIGFRNSAIFFFFFFFFFFLNFFLFFFFFFFFLFKNLKIWMVLFLIFLNVLFFSCRCFFLFPLLSIAELTRRWWTWIVVVPVKQTTADRYRNNPLVYHWREYKLFLLLFSSKTY